MNYTTLKNVTTLANSTAVCKLENDIYDLLPKIMKITGTLLYLGFFLLAIKIKEMRSRHMIYLYNLSFVGLSTTAFYGFTSFNTYCEAPLVSMCEYQALFAYYTIYVTAYGVVALAMYRLACVKLVHVKNYVTTKRMLISVFIIWLMPIFAIIIPAYAAKIPIFYNVSSASCRMDLTKYIDYFLAYFVIANVLPSVFVLIIDIVIFVVLKGSKNRVSFRAVYPSITGSIVQPPRMIEHSTMRTAADHTSAVTGQTKRRKKLKVSVEMRLLLQLTILFIVFEIYAVTNAILLFQASTTNKLVNTETLKILRLFRWGYHIINPIVYLFFHPIIMEKLKKMFRNLFAK